MSALRKLFKQTFIYGLATVLPRALGIVLVPLYVSVLGKAEYGVYAALMAFLILGNVLLSYGMETAFFRFINKHKAQKEKVQSTALSSLTVSTLLFLSASMFFSEELAGWMEFRTEFVRYGLLILALDALAVIPFVWYRANEKPMRYAVIKIFNVIINLGLNLFFFLWLPDLAEWNPNSVWDRLYFAEHKVAYVFISNLVASAITLLILSPLYIRIGFRFDHQLWKGMMRYGIPVLIAGIAFSINEAFDKILLKYMLPPDIAEAELGVYAACYKLGVFMTLFATAFRLGVEPFFFNHAKEKNAPETYATITRYYSIMGSSILLFVIVFIDVFKRILIPESAYWEALIIVPVILLANLCLGIYHNLSVWYKISDRTHYGAMISVFGAIITLVMNLALIPLISYKGSALATLAAYGSMMVISYLIGRKKYPIPYDVKAIVGYMILASGFGIVSFYVFEGNLAIGSTLLLVFLTIVSIVERNKLKKLFRK